MSADARKLAGEALVIAAAARDVSDEARVMAAEARDVSGEARVVAGEGLEVATESRDLATAQASAAGRGASRTASSRKPGPAKPPRRSAKTSR